MADVFPKFIIEGDVLVIAKCKYHKELVHDKEKVKGGGWWRLDKETNTMILDGDSHDFGAAKVEDIKACIDKGNVFSDSYQLCNISDRYNFSYDTRTEIIVLKTSNNN